MIKSEGLVLKGQIQNNNRKKMLTKNYGFTLIELSIVMVIIGLIIGGILTGRELIHGADVRATVSQITEYNAAVNNFNMKYNAIPGDFITASTYIAGSLNGNGDGLVSLVNGPKTPVATSVNGQKLETTSGNTCNEVVNFWSHLASSGIINGSYPPLSGLSGPAQLVNTNFPATKINSSIGIIVYGNYHDYINYYALGVTQVGIDGANSYVYSANLLSPSDALAIDTKIDDGNPISGIVVARNPTSSSYVGQGLESIPTITGSSTLSTNQVTQCLAGTTYGTAPNYYNTAASVSSALCQLRIRLNQP